MKTGLSTHKRVHARNFTHDPAQKRLEETLPAFDKQTENALRVNTTHIEFYRVMSSGVPCTCSERPIMDDQVVSRDSNVQPVIDIEEHGRGETSITLRKATLFGEGEAERSVDVDDHYSLMENVDDHDTDAIEELMTQDDTGEINFGDSVLGQNVDCGICYRTGFSPGYVPARRHHVVLTSLELCAAQGYYVNSTAVPNTLEKQDKNGYTEFEFVVPRFFVDVRVSVRNNNMVLSYEDLLTVAGETLTLSVVRQHAGKTLRIRVSAQVFTHVVLDFRINKKNIMANLSGDTSSLDYARLSTLSNFQVVVPNDIHHISSGDVIIATSRKLALKVVDVNKKRTATGHVFGWELGTRVLQPSETINNLTVSRILR